jgi:UDP-glucose:(heptosyl)LPS alpha-1,3-glucosyltransferase
MKIAIAINSLCIARGGAERFTVNILRGLKQRGHELTVMCTEWDTAAENIGVDLIHVDVGKRYTRRRFSSAVHAVYSPEKYGLLYGLTQLCPQDVHRFGGGVYAYWFRKKYGAAYQVKRFLPKVRHLLEFEKEMYAQENVRRLIAISEMDRRIIHHYFSFPDDKIHTVYNGFDMEIFHSRGREEAREKLCHRHHIKNTQTIVLFAANNYIRKGLPEAIASLRYAQSPRSYTLVVIGKSHRKTRARMIRLINNAFPVVWCDHVQSPAEYYRGTDVLLFPTQYDSFANVTGEALLCGLPVITTRHAGGAEMITEGENGYVVPRAQDIAALSACVQRFRNTDMRNEFSKKAPRKVQHLTIEKCAEETEKVLEAALKDKNQNCTVIPQI